MDKNFLDIAGFTPLLNRFLRQKSSLRFGEKCKKGGSIRKPISGFTVFKGSGRQYCMQSIPLAVFFYFSVRFFQTAAFFYGIMELSKKNLSGEG